MLGNRQHSTDSKNSLLSCTNFSFLDNRYDIGFMVRLINDYFFILFLASYRLQCDPEIVFNKILSKIYEPEPEKIEPSSCIELAIESNELAALGCKEKFLLIVIEVLLLDYKYSTENIKSKLNWLTGLLIMNQHDHLKDRRRPKLIETSNSKIIYRHPHVIKTKAIIYKNDCKRALFDLNNTQPFGRTYTFIAGEYFDFLERFISNCSEFTTPSLKKLLNHWHNHYKTKRSELLKSRKKQDFTIPPSDTYNAIITINPYYLQGKPHGSNRQKK